VGAASGDHAKYLIGQEARAPDGQARVKVLEENHVSAAGGEVTGVQELQKLQNKKKQRDLRAVRRRISQKIAKVAKRTKMRESTVDVSQVLLTLVKTLRSQKIQGSEWISFLFCNSCNS
jgi:hypothetical protein